MSVEIYPPTRRSSMRQLKTTVDEDLYRLIEKNKEMIEKVLGKKISNYEWLRLTIIRVLVMDGLLPKSVLPAVFGKNNPVKRNINERLNELEEKYKRLDAKIEDLKNTIEKIANIIEKLSEK